jgi:hypothetical protein
MDERELIRKLKNEEALRADESLWLDEAIEGGAASKGLVEALPDALPSLAWRSRLNERLMAAVPQRSPWWRRAFAPTLATAGAAACALFLWNLNLKGGSVPTDGGEAASLEQMLISAHQEASLEESGFFTLPVDLVTAPDL